MSNLSTSGIVISNLSNMYIHTSKDGMDIIVSAGDGYQGGVELIHSVRENRTFLKFNGGLNSPTGHFESDRIFLHAIELICNHFGINPLEPLIIYQMLIHSHRKQDDEWLFQITTLRNNCGEAIISNRRSAIVSSKWLIDNGSINNLLIWNHHIEEIETIDPDEAILQGWEPELKLFNTHGHPTPLKIPKI